LEGEKLVVILNGLGPDGVPEPAQVGDGKKATSAYNKALDLYNEAQIPSANGLRRLAKAFDGHVFHMKQGDAILVPRGKWHAAVNITRCVSWNTTYLPKSSVLEVLQTTSQSNVQLAISSKGLAKFGHGFNRFVVAVADLKLRNLQACFSRPGRDGYTLFCTLLGECHELARIVLCMVSIGCPLNSRINEEWRDGLSAHILESCSQIQGGMKLF
jgi:hypothetical protein